MLCSCRERIGRELSQEGELGDVLQYGHGGNPAAGECEILVEISERRRSHIFSPQEIAPDRKSCEGDEEEENEGARRLFSFAVQNPMEIVAQEKDAQRRP